MLRAAGVLLLLAPPAAVLRGIPASALLATATGLVLASGSLLALLPAGSVIGGLPATGLVLVACVLADSRLVPRCRRAAVGAMLGLLAPGLPGGLTGVALRPPCPRVGLSLSVTAGPSRSRRLFVRAPGAAGSVHLLSASLLNGSPGPLVGSRPNLVARLQIPLLFALALPAVSAPLSSLALLRRLALGSGLLTATLFPPAALAVVGLALPSVGVGRVVVMHRRTPD